MLPPLSTASADDGMLVVIDIQDRLAAAMRTGSAVSAASCLLIRAAAIVGMPIVVTRQYPKGLGDTEIAVAGALHDAAGEGVSVTAIDKMTFDCFAEPAFVEAVCASGRRQLVLAGMETHICVAQTALAGLREGYDVHVVADACCSRETYAHDTTVLRLSAAGAAATLSESVAYELVGEAGTPGFKRLLAAVKAADAGR